MKELIEKGVSELSPCPGVSPSPAMPDADGIKLPDTAINSGVQDVPREDQRPCYWLHISAGRWGKAGVYWYPVVKEEKNQESNTPEWMCSPLEVLARTRDIDNNSWGRQLIWHDGDGIKKAWNLPDRLLMGDSPSTVLGELADGGLDISLAKKKQVLAYIAVQNPHLRATCISKTGWAAVGVYVTPDCVINEVDAEHYVYQAIERPEARRSKGSLASWRTEVAALCIGNSRLMLAVSAAFSGPLLFPCGFSGGGFHFQGPSSIGKSLSMLLAASVSDAPEQAVVPWRVTDNGLEGVAARHNDGLLMLDELGQVDGRKAGEIAYMLSNGSGKARASRDGSPRRRQEWRVVFISNGEIDLATHMRAAGQSTKAGQEIRMVTIPADAGKGMGIFEQLHGEPNSKHMADRVKAAALNHYGIAFMPFVQYVAQHWDQVAKQGRKIVSAFVQSAVPAGADGQVMRGAERFGIVAAAGELATQADITGWPPGAATQAARICFDAWLTRRGGAGSHEEAEIIKRLLETITRDAACFESINQGEQATVRNRLGFVDGDRYLMTISNFKEVMFGIDDQLAARVLVSNGIIRHEIGKKLPRESLPGLGRQRVYIVEARHLPDELGGTFEQSSCKGNNPDTGTPAPEAMSIVQTTSTLATVKDSTISDTGTPRTPKYQGVL